MAFLLNFIMKLTGWPVWALVARTKFYYEDKSVSKRRIKGAAIVMSNHTSVWDFAAVMFMFPWRNIRCVVAELMYEKNIFMTALLKGLATIPVDRNSYDFAFVEKCCKALKKGKVVEIYPESKIPDKEETELLEFKPSITAIALESGAPIIPVYTDGSYFTKSRNRIIIGKPVDVRGLYDSSKTEKQNIEDITNILRGKINELKTQVKKEIL